MRVLFCHRPGGAFGYITDGMINAFKDKGHTTRRWDGKIESWNTFDPDIYIGCSGHKQPIPRNRSAKIAIHVNPYGPVKIDGINESLDNINWVVDQKPDAVFGYGFESDRVFWSDWYNKHGIPWVPTPTAGDKTLFHDRNQEDHYDIVYLGGRWSYKGLTIDSFLIPLLRTEGIKFKLHGWGDWPNGFCDGILPEDKVVQFLNSGKIGPCVSERHTQKHGIDVPERVWKLALCGTASVHDCVPTLKENFDNAVIAKDPSDFKERCINLIEDDAERCNIAINQMNEVLEKHTYHHRMANILEALGYSSEAQDMLK